MPASRNSVPLMSDYGIDQKTGFLPNPSPLRRLPEVFEPWENIMDHLQGLIMTGSLRERIQRLPLLSVDGLTKVEERRVYSVLTFLAHGYCYGVPHSDQPVDILPKSIALPWFQVAKKLNIHPVASYSGVALWNWYLLDETKPLDLNYHTFSGVYDESWFYLVPVVIDYHGASIITCIVEAQRAILVHDTQKVLENVSLIADKIKELIPILKRMYERCDPQVFWKRVRAYSGGSKNSEYFPNGIFYEGVMVLDHHVNRKVPNPPGLEGTWRQYPGASAGQSPLIHTIDVGLSIEHQPVGTCPVSGASAAPCPSGKHLPNPMIEMREALPREFQEFIKDLAVAPNIKQYCQSNKDFPKLAEEFNRACLNMKEFRDVHLQMATQYIVLQRKGSSTAVGTGGTDLVPFLKQVRNETLENTIS